MRLGRCQPDTLALGPNRTVDPPKAVFFPMREDLGTWSGASGALAPGDSPGAKSEARPRALVGVAACDVHALAVLDHVFLHGDVADPGYQSRREATLVIAADCQSPREVCFCAALGHEPYSQKGYDLNVSRITGGYLIESGSDTGATWLADHGASLSDATDTQMEQRDQRRQEVHAQVQEQVRQAGMAWNGDTDQHVTRIREQVRATRGAPLWENAAENCVECAACNLICPTCHCFLLSDGGEAGAFHRYKTWDACQYPRFARVAGGANPMKRRAARLYNRFEKKFDFLVAELGEPGCMGCGRCVEACAGKLDIREMLRELGHAKPVSANPEPA